MIENQQKSVLKFCKCVEFMDSGICMKYLSTIDKVQVWNDS